MGHCANVFLNWSSSIDSMAPAAAKAQQPPHCRGGGVGASELAGQHTCCEPSRAGILRWCSDMHGIMQQRAGSRLQGAAQPPCPPCLGT